MPPAIPVILAGIQAAIAIAPQVEEIVVSAKALITALFTAKLLSKEQQDALHLWVDAQAALAVQGIVPPSWQVQANPS